MKRLHEDHLERFSQRACSFQKQFRLNVTFEFTVFTLDENELQ